MNDKEKGILKAIIYFDIFDFPLAIFEVWKYFYSPSPLEGLWRINSNDQKISLLEIQEILEKSEALKDIIDRENGFYFLKGRGNIIKTRLERYNLAKRKFRRAKKIIKILSFIPFIRLIAVCNTLGYSNAQEESDIDLFIVTDKNRIWTARFWSALILKLFGLRPTKTMAKDKICLSFFVSLDHLNLDDLTLKPEDIYFDYWLNQLAPIYDAGDIYSRFIENNKWVLNFLPNSINYQVNWRRETKLGLIGRAIKQLKEKFFSFIPEKIFEKIQLEALPLNLKKLANLDTRVVINSQVLKFHGNDRREEFGRIFKEKFLKYENI